MLQLRIRIILMNERLQLDFSGCKGKGVCECFGGCFCLGEIWGLVGIEWMGWTRGKGFIDTCM